MRKYAYSVWFVSNNEDIFDTKNILKGFFYSACVVY